MAFATYPTTEYSLNTDHEKDESLNKLAILTYASSRNDWQPLGGTLCLSLYIGTWLLSCAAPFITLLLFFCHQYAICAILTVCLLLCYVIPVSPHAGFRSWARCYFSRFFYETSIRFEHLPDPLYDRPTILCINPHGIFSLSWSYCYLMDELQHFYWCFSTLLRLSPLFRILTQSIGHPSNIRKSTIMDHMTHRRCIAMIPGGWHEGSLHNPSYDRLYIRERQGFVKYALQFGYTITPSYGFGERKTYWNPSGGYRLRFWLNDLGILTVLPFGLWWCPLLPRPTTLHVVIGSPIQLPHIPKPEKQHVDYWHSIYMSEVQQLYNRYKFFFYGQEAHKLTLQLW